ncbi:MAG TPA: hypothetical protein DDY14_06795 [Chromatiaceae bacterium]|nr:hypothetical protein [Chromatiaceae bacterium]HCS92489.1 hypothetical protein [Chromatiaceae bacterium]
MDRGQMQAILISIGTPLREYRMKQMKQMKQLLQGHLSGLVGIGAAAILFASGTMALADDLSGVGSAADEQLFFKPFETESIPPEERQRWPYSRHTFANWPEFTEFGVARIPPSSNPAEISVAEEQLDLNRPFELGQSFLRALHATQTAGFVVMRDNQILGEFYDNGLLLGNSYILMSSAKTITAIVVHKLIDAGLIDPSKPVQYYVEDFKGSDIGQAPIQTLLDMTSGMPTLFDYDTPGSIDQQYEFELGMRKGAPIGLINVIRQYETNAAPGERWQYNDMNTDTLAIVASRVTGKKFEQLLGELFDEIGTNHEAWIALTSEGLWGANCCIGMSARDYALFHQWIATGNAPASYYASALDKSKDQITQVEVMKPFKHDSYGSQTYHMHDENVLISIGSFGQMGFSNMDTGISIVFLQAWSANAVAEKIVGNKRMATVIANLYRND